MAMQKTAADLGPEVLRKYVKPLEGKVGDVDPTALAVKVVARVVEKSEVCSVLCRIRWYCLGLGDLAAVAAAAAAAAATCCLVVVVAAAVVAVFAFSRCCLAKEVSVRVTIMSGAVSTAVFLTAPFRRRLGSCASGDR